MSRKNCREKKLKRQQQYRNRETEQEKRKEQVKKNREIREQEKEAEKILGKIGLNEDEDWEDQMSQSGDMEDEGKIAKKQKKIKKTKTDHQNDKKKARKMKNKPIIIHKDDEMDD